MKILFGLIEIGKKGILIPFAKIRIPFKLAILSLKFFAHTASATKLAASEEAVSCHATMIGDMNGDGIKDLMIGCQRNSLSEDWICVRFGQAENSLIPLPNKSCLNEDEFPSDFYLTVQKAKDLRLACEAGQSGALPMPPDLSTYLNEDKSIVPLKQ